MAEPVRRMVVTEIGDRQRRRLAAAGADVLYRTHSLVVSSDDAGLLKLAVQAARAGIVVRNRVVSPSQRRLAPMSVLSLDAAARRRLGKTYPGILERPHSVVIAGKDRQALLTVMRMLRSGTEMLVETVAPRSEIAPATVVLSDAERRGLVARHPELRRTRAAVAVSYPTAAPLALIHVHPDAARELASERNPGVVVVRPDPVERKELRSRHRELAVNDELLVFAASEIVDPLRASRLMRAVARFRVHVSDVEWGQLPPSRPAPMADRAVAERRRFSETHRVFSATEVGLRAGSVQANPARLAQQWKSQGRLIAYRDAGTVVYPAFQFGSDGKPRPEIERVIAATAPVLRGGLAQAVWFTKANRHLDGRTPLEVVGTNTGAVIYATHQRLLEHTRRIQRDAQKRDRGHGVA